MCKAWDCILSNILNLYIAYKFRDAVSTWTGEISDHQSIEAISYNNVGFVEK